MNTLKINTHKRSFNYIADQLLVEGFYQTTKTKSLNENYKKMRSEISNKSYEIYRLGKDVLLRTRKKNNSRVDFLMTEEVCFDSIALLSDNYFDYEFYDQFVEAFEMLDYQQYENSDWIY